MITLFDPSSSQSSDYWIMLIFVVIEMIKTKIFLFILNVHFNSSKEKILQYDIPT